jgi:lipopolysaccharide/colanic/teichoic acid biosynthesis glycosyltransferase
LSNAAQQPANAESLLYGHGSEPTNLLEWPFLQYPSPTSTRSSLHLVRNKLSPWSRCAAKRVFDCACVLLALPFLAPVLLGVALAVRMTSSGPILFLQRRMGRRRRTFTILKFRTIHHEAASHAVTTAANQPFTPIGQFLRRWKLDELPQVINVLMGHMSLVGPRPKLPEHMVLDLPCRPGITGAATLAFAREETILDRIPRHRLESYYHNIVLPTKHHLDTEYMARASFLSDLRIIARSVFRRWDHSVTRSMAEVIPSESDREIKVERLLTVRASTHVGTM